MKKFRIRKILYDLFLAALIYLLACCLLPPLIPARREAPISGISPEPSWTEGGERVLCIDDNTDALTWRIRVIESAREEIILSTFNFCDDSSGLDIMSALKAAADRGVSVKLLIDGLYGLKLKQSADFLSLISLPGVEAKLYNPLNLAKAWPGNYRLHDKYLIADHSSYLMGGRNIGDLFLGDYSAKANIDRDILVTGASDPGRQSDQQTAVSSLDELRQYFDAVWNLDSCKTMSCRQSQRKTQAGLNALDSHYETLKSDYPEAFEPADWDAFTIPAERIMLCTNPIAPENKSPKLWKSLCGLMAESQKAVIQTPYVMCSREMYSDLSLVTKGGTEVTLLTNSAETGANPWGCSDYLNQKKNILKTGVNICEFAGEHSAHTKTILLDDQISIIGSYNMDIRSSYLDTEMMLVIDSPELNRTLRENAEAMKQKGRLLTPGGTVTYGEHYTAPGKNAVRVILQSVLRILCPLIRHVL